ncbi:MAG: 30S ribosomal protein S20 [Micropepsaceae bacterium]
MAQHKSAKTRIRRNARRAAVNRSRVGRIRTAIRKVENAIGAGDKKAAAEALGAAQPDMQRGVSKGLLHKNTVARKISRLNARIKSLA